MEPAWRKIWITRVLLRRQPRFPETGFEPSLPADSGSSASRTRRFVFGCLHVILSYGSGLFLGLCGLPAAAVLFLSYQQWGIIGLMVALFPASLLFLTMYTLLLPVLKKAVYPTPRPGRYSLYSGFYLRKWTVDGLFGLSKTLFHQLYTTIYLPPWLRLLGAKIGPGAEISTVSQLSPEMVEIAGGSFLADGSILPCQRLFHDTVEVGQTSIGARSFVGNSAIVPVHKGLGTGSLLGVLSNIPSHQKTPPSESEWLGSPAFSLPNRKKVEGFDEVSTHRPTRRLILQRLLVDGARIVTPPAIVSGTAALLILYAFFALQSSPAWMVFLLLPIVTMVLWGGAIGCVVLLKKVLIPHFKPTIQPLWCMYVWVNEWINGAFETIVAPALVPFLGTPFAAPVMRAMGCNVGRDVYLETTLFSEFDLVTIEEGASLNRGVVIQNHLFEDRIFKSSHLTIGEKVTVANMAVVLYDTKLESNCRVEALSLVMKGEQLPQGTQWYGIPIQQIQPESS